MTIKKIFLYFIALCTLFFASSDITYAMPGDGNNLLAGKVATTTIAAGNFLKGTSFITDGQDSTYSQISPSAAGKITYTFSTPVQVNGTYCYILSQGSSYTVKMYTNTGTSVSITCKSTASTSYTSITPVAGVNRVEIDKGGGGSNWFVVYELALTGPFVDSTPPPVPFGLSVTGGNGEGGMASLSWNAVTAADLAGYHIYQDGVRVTSVPVTETFNVIRGLTNGQQYKYAVSSIDKTGNESALSAVVTVIPVIPPDITPPSAPLALLGTALDGAAKLSWQNSPENDVAGYYVFKDGVRITTNLVQTPFQVTGLVNDRAYSFDIAAVDSSGNVSSRSYPVIVTPLSLPPKTSWGELPRQLVSMNIADVLRSIGQLGTSLWTLIALVVALLLTPYLPKILKWLASGYEQHKYDRQYKSQWGEMPEGRKRVGYVKGLWRGRHWEDRFGYGDQKPSKKTFSKPVRKQPKISKKSHDGAVPKNYKKFKNSNRGVAPKNWNKNQKKRR